MGVTVRLATATADTSLVHRPWRVHWAVTAHELIRLCRWADVIHMNGFRAAVVGAALLARHPVVWTHHEYSFCRPGWGGGAVRIGHLPPMQCWACLRDRGFDAPSARHRMTTTVVRHVSSRLVAEHTTVTRYMKDRLELVAATVVPLGVSANPGGRSEVIATPSNSFRVVYSGRLIPEKGVDVAIRAIALARQHGLDARLEIVGDGPERSVLEGLASRELPPSAVAFMGQLEPDLALARMQSADAVIVPSVWSEPAGYVVIEAMAMGVPVIAAETGGIPEIARGAALPHRAEGTPTHSRMRCWGWQRPLDSGKP